MAEKIIVYHGSSKIIEKPIWGMGNPNNDYGLGFYCTENEELAKEWACSSESDGYANKYSLDLTDTYKLIKRNIKIAKNHIMRTLTFKYIASKN